MAAIYGGPIPVAMTKDEQGAQSLELPQPRFAIHASMDASLSSHWKPGQIVWVSIPSERLSIGNWLRRWFFDWWEDVTAKRQAT
jgi:hypothetical protein